MPSYSFNIRKADHINVDGTNDLHVHIWFNKGHSRIFLGRYRLPTLEPVFQSHRELNAREIEALREWLAQPEQIRKLNSCLDDTLFDTHKMARKIPAFGEIMIEKDGETYVNIRMPVSGRI